jgi:hypothetical protein
MIFNKRKIPLALYCMVRVTVSVMCDLKQWGYNCSNTVTYGKTNQVKNRFGMCAIQLSFPFPYLLKGDATEWFIGTKH